MGLQRSQWVALGLVLLRTPVAGWFDGKKLITSILIMAGLVLFATGAFPEFVSALLVLTLAPADVVFGAHRYRLLARISHSAPTTFADQAW